MGNTGSDPAAGAEDVAKEAEKVEYVIEEVAKHKHKRDCWIVIHGWVLDVTPFLEDHPGGTSVILDHAGTDASSAFDDMDHSSSAKKLMLKFAIGKLVKTKSKPAAAPAPAAAAAPAPA